MIHSHVNHNVKKYANTGQQSWSPSMVQDGKELSYPVTRPNRPAQYDDVLEKIRWPEDETGALLFIDLDSLEWMNASMDRAFEEHMIQIVTDRLTQTVGARGSVYHLGADTFLVHLRLCDSLEEIIGYSREIMDCTRTPLPSSVNLTQTAVSIGISLYPEHAGTPDELFRCALIAMQKAKANGKNRAVLFEKTMKDAHSERILIGKCLQTALKNREFQVFYQPQINLESDTISGFEALLRWNSPQLGEVPPQRFIKVAEDNHVIIEIGRWILQTACTFLKKLHTHGYTGLTMSVNISSLQLLRDEFVDDVLETLFRLGLKPECLELEITESRLMESLELAGQRLEQLRLHGVRIALDDFGKGASSLYRLVKLPITTLKIDKSFIDDVAQNEKARTLAGQIVAMGKSMELCIIAEGVETQEQLDYLVQTKCDKVQGFLFHRPMTEQSIEALVEL